MDTILIVDDEKNYLLVLEALLSAEGYETMAAQSANEALRLIDESDLDLLQVVEEPQQAVDAIFAYYEKRGFEPSPDEREILLNL